VLKAASDSAALMVATSGTLEQWKDNIARLICGNDLPVVVMSSAFVSPLLDFMAEASGGFHLAGLSKLGKTFVCEAAATVHGSPAKGAIVRDWRTTANALEATAEEFNDFYLGLDEIVQADPREIIGSVYMLANESGKGRLNRDAILRRRRTWRNWTISTGEHDLSAVAARAGQVLPAGVEVRMPSLPATAETMWKALHQSRDAKALMLKIRDNMRKFYGCAGRPFLQHLVDARNNNPAQVTDAVHAQRTKFSELVTRNWASADAQVYEVARRFALVAAAGELAIKWNILPWPQGEAAKACTAIFTACIGKRGSAAPTEEGQQTCAIRMFLLENGASRFVELRRHKTASGETWEEPHPDRPVINRAGWKRKLEDGRFEYLIPPEIWRGICSKASVDAVETARTLRRNELLAPGDGKNLTKDARIPGVGKDRFYIVQPDILGGADPTKQAGL
jgi:putative DNA primase/helicase